MCVLLDSNWEDKRFWTKWLQKFHEINLLLISLCMQFYFIGVISSIQILPYFQGIYYFCVLWFCHECCSQDNSIYPVFSAFTSRPVRLLASKKAYVFFFIVFMFVSVK